MIIYKINKYKPVVNPRPPVCYKCKGRVDLTNHFKSWTGDWNQEKVRTIYYCASCGNFIRSRYYWLEVRGTITAEDNKLLKEWELEAERWAENFMAHEEEFERSLEKSEK